VVGAARLGDGGWARCRGADSFAVVPDGLAPTLSWADETMFDPRSALRAQTVSAGGEEGDMRRRTE
jgi:hypothetical protein